MFQFPGFPLHRLWIHLWVTGLQPAGFPHSDIMGSMPACGSPMLFAACHVLLRRLVPWHPPCALVRLIFLRMTFVIVDPETNCLIFFPVNCYLILQLVFKDFFSSFFQMCGCQCACKAFALLPEKFSGGGSQWTRTTDLSLIRRVL